MPEEKNEELEQSELKQATGGQVSMSAQKSANAKKVTEVREHVNTRFSGPSDHSDVQKYDPD